MELRLNQPRRGVLPACRLAAAARGAASLPPCPTLPSKNKRGYQHKTSYCSLTSLHDAIGSSPNAGGAANHGSKTAGGSATSTALLAASGSSRLEERRRLLGELDEMGLLLLTAGCAPTKEMQALFKSVRERAFAAVEQTQAQHPLSLRRCCRLLLACARARLPLSGQEQENLEMAATRDLAAAQLQEPKRLEELLSAYSCLGMRPGSGMLAALSKAAAQLSGRGLPVPVVP